MVSERRGSGVGVTMSGIGLTSSRMRLAWARGCALRARCIGQAHRPIGWRAPPRDPYAIDDHQLRLGHAAGCKAFVGMPLAGLRSPPSILMASSTACPSPRMTMAIRSETTVASFVECGSTPVEHLRPRAADIAAPSALPGSSCFRRRRSPFPR